MAKPQNLKNLAGFGGNSIDTTDADQEGEFVFSGDIERSLALGLALETDFVSFFSQIFTVVFLCALVNGLASSPVLLSRDNSGLSLGGFLLLNAFPLLQDGFWDSCFRARVTLGKFLRSDF